jgi:hypothetical protein
MLLPPLLETATLWPKTIVLELVPADEPPPHTSLVAPALGLVGGDEKVCTPVNVCPASCRANVKEPVAIGDAAVTVLEAAMPAASILKRHVGQEAFLTSAVASEKGAEADDGVCHVAAVEPVAVNTCPFDGAVADDTLTTVVAEFSASVFADFPVVSAALFGICADEAAPLISVNVGCALVNAPVVELYAVKKFDDVAVVFAAAAVHVSTFPLASIPSG